MKSIKDRIEHLKKLKLLFIEDEVELLDIIENTLKKLSINFFRAENAFDALNIIENHDIDIVITDINLPKMSGLELVKCLRQNDNDIPIIIMSAYTEEEYREEARKLGVNNYLLKPFDFNDFIEVLINIKIDKKYET